MAEQEYLIYPSGAWSSQHPPHKGAMGRDGVNMNGANGFAESDRGYAIDRLIAANIGNAGGSWVHTDENGKDWEWLYSNDQLYRNDGATPTAIGTVISTENFVHAQYNMSSPCGFSGFFHGVNAEAKLIRNLAGTVGAVLHDIAAPVLATVTTAATGGSIADGTYQVRTAWKDDAGAVTVFTHPSNVDAITTAGGGVSTITIPEPVSAPGRVVDWRYAITSVGATDAPANYTKWVDAAVASGDITITALPAETGSQAFNDINGTYRQATLPITAVDVAWLGEGRLWVASTADNKVAWSERDNTNHWYTDQVLNAAAETGLTAPVVGGAEIDGKQLAFTRESVHVIYGDYTRDDQGNSPTYAIRIAQDPLAKQSGIVSHGSIVLYGNELYAWTTNFGPARLVGPRWEPLMPEAIRPFMRRQFDETKAQRIYGAFDPELLCVCWIVPRKTNASRAFDGASTAGICDYMIRWDVRHQFFTLPRQVDLVHISTRVHPSGQGSKPGSAGNTGKNWLMGVGIGGHMLRFNLGNSGGGATDAATSTDNDGLNSTVEATTSLTVVLAGKTNDDDNGKTLTLFYQSDDATTPYVVVQKTITDTVVSGSNVTWHWQGALVVPTTAWTARLAGLRQPIDGDHDWRQYLQVAPGARVDFQGIEGILRDVAGQEAIA